MLVSRRCHERVSVLKLSDVIAFRRYCGRCLHNSKALQALRLGADRRRKAAGTRLMIKQVPGAIVDAASIRAKDQLVEALLRATKCGNYIQYGIKSLLGGAALFFSS